MDAKMLMIAAYLFLFMPVKSYTQIYDDFSDGDFSENPAWNGTEPLFTVNKELQLQLNAEGGGEAYLYCSQAFGQHARHQWQFWLREAFSPSGNNYCDIMLCDNYFIRFGEAGSSDVLELFRRDGDSNVSVCRGSDSFIASAFAAWFKVTRDDRGTWKIYIDKLGNSDYQLDAQGIDDTYDINGNFGIKAFFTSSNSKRVYLDDVYFGPLIVDTDPPCLTEVKVLKYNKLQLNFNEVVEGPAVLDSDNYSVDNQIGNPMYVEYNGNDRSQLILSFANTIQEGLNYTLTINKIQDVEGNMSENILNTFLYYNTKANDVVINEIMADPEPEVGLPACEYIELYNSTEFPISLKDWLLVIGTGEKVITQDVEIQPYGYLLLCKTESVPALEEYGQCVDFASFAITNSGVGITLRDAESRLVSEVKFDLSWYHDSNKTDGGWSLEQIDPLSPCAGGENWRASCHRDGGTPGAKNSVDAPNVLMPQIDYIDMLSTNSMQLFFNQRMDENSLENIENYTVVEFDGHPVSAGLQPNQSNSVVLTFDMDFTYQKVYTIKVDNLYNCSGMPIGEGNGFQFGIPDEAEFNDVVINEILFDPVAPAGDYVEIYNNSDKVINISDLKLGMVKETFPNPPDTTIKTICTENRQLLPGHYALLTTTPTEIGSQYDCTTDNFIMMGSFPSYPNSGAAAVLFYGTEVIDAMRYSDDSHYPLLAETTGVALERVSPDIASDYPENWHSAAAPLYGTPGYRNSVFIENTESDETVDITPTVFSPDGDGFDDVTTINLNNFDNGYTVRITIFDSQGRLTKTLINNQNIGQSNRFVWNGRDENNNIVPFGIYVAFVEVFDIQGDIKRFKKAVVVAGK